MSAQVCEAAGHGHDDADDLHEEVRRSLFDAVNDVHPEHHEVTGARLQTLSDERRRYSWTWTTNYDLLPYWATMDAASGIKDFFWGPETPLTASTRTCGGGHCSSCTAVSTSTWTPQRASAASGLGCDSSTPVARAPDRSPLLIGEATSADKMRSIRRSDYLSFAYRTLIDFEDPLVIFGHRLAENDGRIVDAINKYQRRPIAYSVYPGGGLDVVALKTRVQQLLPGRKIHFFDSQTHPLGAASQALP